MECTLFACGARRVRLIAVAAVFACVLAFAAQALALPLGSLETVVPRSAGQSAGRLGVLDDVNNDMFANRIALSTHLGQFWYDTGTNAGYTAEPGEPQHAGRPGGRSAWFRWTAPSDGVLTLDTFSSDFDTLLGVYVGSAVDTLTAVASNDDYNGTDVSLVSFPVTAGTEYEIAVDGYQGQSGIYYLEWEFSPNTAVPVWRFYNKSGSHFYTASGAEAAWVWTSLSTTFSLDGPAYSIDTLNPLNSAPLYRFYNKKNGSHFYTASEAEKASVIAHLGATYTYDGPAYNVCLTPGPGETTVYRFYNKKNGSHFYTASEAEKTSVLTTLRATYSYDGPAFYLAP